MDTGRNFDLRFFDQHGIQMDLQRIRSSKWLTVAIVGLFLMIVVMGYFLLDRFLLSPPIDATIERTDLLVRQGEQIQVNVLNGCGEDGVARQTMDYLRARGFDVVEITNYERFGVEHSFVIDRVGDTLSAQKVAYALGIADSLLVTDIDSTLYLRGSVVLGRDYNILKPFQQ